MNGFVSANRVQNIKEVKSTRVGKGVNSGEEGARLSQWDIRDIRDKGTRWQSFVHVVHQRTLTRNGDVPISSSVQDCATRGKLHAVFHMLRISVPSACLGKNLRSKVFHCAKLRDGTRDSVLALIHMQSFTLAVLRRSALFEYFAYFVVSPSTLAVLYMLRVSGPSACLEDLRDRFAGRAELARYTLCVPNEPEATLVSLAHPRL